MTDRTTLSTEPTFDAIESFLRSLNTSELREAAYQDILSAMAHVAADQDNDFEARDILDHAAAELAS